VDSPAPKESRLRRPEERSTQQNSSREVSVSRFSARARSPTSPSIWVPQEALRKRLRQADANSGKRGGAITREEREEIKKLWSGPGLDQSLRGCRSGLNSNNCRIPRLKRRRPHS